MMEEDGVMIWMGYLASTVSTAYFAFFGTMIVRHLGHWLHALGHWLNLLQ